MAGKEFLSLFRSIRKERDCRSVMSAMSVMSDKSLVEERFLVGFGLSGLVIKDGLTVDQDFPRAPAASYELAQIKESAHMAGRTMQV